MLFQVWKFVRSSADHEIATRAGAGGTAIVTQQVSADAARIANGGNVSRFTIIGGVFGTGLILLVLSTLAIMQGVERRVEEDRHRAEASAEVARTERRHAEEARQSSEAVDEELRRANAEVSKRRVEQTEAERLRATAAEDLRGAEAIEEQTRAAYEAARQVVEKTYQHQRDAERLRDEERRVLEDRFAVAVGQAGRQPPRSDPSGGRISRRNPRGERRPAPP